MELKPEDLRIGNYVYRQDLVGHHLRMETIIQLGDKAVTSGPIKVICDYKDLQGVPITEDILLSLGIDGIFAGYKIVKNYDETFTIYLLYQGNMIFMRHIRYVHDLQNWYYHKDDMKKELKLKEQ